MARGAKPGAKARGSKTSRGKGARGARPSRLRALLAGFLFGKPVDEDTSDRLSEIKGLLLIGFALWLFISMVSYYTPHGDPGAGGWNWGGQAGYYLANGAFITMGLAGYLVAILVACWGGVIVARKEVTWASLRLVGGVCFVMSMAFLLELGWGRASGATDAVETARLPYGPGGWLASQSTPFLVGKFGDPGLWLILVMLSLVSFMLATEMAFWPALLALREWLEERREERGESLGVALGGWLRTLALGLWNFLRGADLAGLEPVPAGGPGARRGRSRTSDEFDPDDVDEKAAAAAEAAPSDDDADDDEEWEYVYEDEEGAGEEGDEEEDDEEADEDEEVDEDLEEEEEPAELVPAAQRVKPKVRTGGGRALDFEPPSPPDGPWTFPPLDLLEAPERGGGVDEPFLEQSATKLENALKSFRVEAEVVAAQVGPAVTMFELTVAQGTRMNKVTQLSQEIAAALQARSVRIIAPIPGRSTVGIEVPNSKRRVVRLSELIPKDAYDNKKMALPLFLGMDAEGNAIVEDLSRMPHLLIAGTTGSGKSVCINTILASLLLTRSPHDVQMILIDPKMVELQMFSKVPHLMLPVVTDVRQATNVLLWAVEKMEGRYELMKLAGVRNIKSFNALGEKKLRERLEEDFDDERTPRHLPYIVVVVDEMADLMMVSKKEAEQAITRLAQKSRAVGIHVIVATQRPSTDVITGVLKGNLPTRIAFQVASKVDSRVILDVVGAEKLLGGGDMLFTPPQSSQLMRVQGALVEDHELQALVDFVCEESAPTFSQELVQAATGQARPGGAEDEDPLARDDLYDDAVRVILKSRRGSASLLQRALGIGYTRASRLIDIMTEQGVVGAHKGSKAREVLLTLEDWEAMHGTEVGQGIGDD